MAESETRNKQMKRHYVGRLSQIRIYFGKFVRTFMYQNDWKVLPISAVVAGLVGMVIRSSFYITREGTLIGALAVSCVCLWNGSFNSIQVICRERAIIKREHHAGMHIFAYTTAHVLFQAIICILQAVITLVMFRFLGVKFPEEGLVLSHFPLEFFITLFLATFAADMMSLFLSSLVHTTTAAMTLMPFVLIFQLIFSGGIFAVPASLKPICDYTISCYGIRCVAAESRYNDMPVIAGWNTLYGMRNAEFAGEATVDEVLSLINRKDNDLTTSINEKDIAGIVTVGDIIGRVMEDENYGLVKDQKYAVRIKIGDILNLVGLDNARKTVEELSSQSGKNDSYASTEDNIFLCWEYLMGIGLAFFFLTMVSLKFVEKDRR